MELVDGYFTYKLSDKQFQLSDAEWKAIKSDKPRPTGVSEGRLREPPTLGTNKAHNGKLVRLSSVLV